MGSLLDLKNEGWSITLYCQGYCTHSWSPSWDQMIQYFGPDYDLVARAGWDRLVCERCGHRGATVIVTPNIEGVTGMKGAGGHNHQAGMSVEEVTRRYHEFYAERRRLGIRSNEELAAETRDKLKAEKRAARTGEDLIGPPNPWKFRKRGRWL